MRRFGPSGSRKKKKKNNALEHRNAVITRRNKDFFVDANGIVLIILLERGCFFAPSDSQLRLWRIGVKTVKFQTDPLPLGWYGSI